jgi:hypothetical protein
MEGFVYDPHLAIRCWEMRSIFSRECYVWTSHSYTPAGGNKRSASLMAAEVSSSWLRRLGLSFSNAVVAETSVPKMLSCSRRTLARN